MAILMGCWSCSRALVPIEAFRHEPDCPMLVGEATELHYDDLADETPVIIYDTTAAADA